MEPTELTLLTSETVSLPTRSSTALNVAKAYQITDDATRRKSGDLIKIFKTLQKMVKDDRKEEFESAQATVTAIREARNRHLTPLEQAEKIMKEKEIAYDDEQERKRLEEQEAINREQQRQAEEKAIADAIALQEMGAPELAEEVLEQAETQPVVPLILPSTTPKVEGQHTTVYWKCRSVCFIDLVKSAANDLEIMRCLQFDQVGANQLVKNLKEKLTRSQAGGGRAYRDNSKIEEIAALPNGTVLTKEMIGSEIPGVEIYIEKSRASRSY